MTLQECSCCAQQGASLVDGQLLGGAMAKALNCGMVMSKIHDQARILPPKAMSEAPLRPAHSAGFRTKSSSSTGPKTLVLFLSCNSMPQPSEKHSHPSDPRLLHDSSQLRKRGCIFFFTDSPPLHHHPTTLTQTADLNDSWVSAENDHFKQEIIYGLVDAYFCKHPNPNALVLREDVDVYRYMYEYLEQNNYVNTNLGGGVAYTNIYSVHEYIQRIIS